MTPTSRAIVAAFAVACSACDTGAAADAPFLGDTELPEPVEAGPEDAGPDPCLDAGDRGDGSTFADLYRDFFGPTGRASCSAQKICHVPGGEGANLSHYICSPDQASCWASMTASIVPDGGSATPETTTLYAILRKARPTPGSGPMPFRSAFAFCPADLDRIKSWIASGAPND